MQFPGISHSGSPQGHRPRWAVCFVPFPGPSSSGNWALDESTVPGGLCSYSPPWSWSLGFLGAPLEHSPSCLMCLLWGADLRLWHSWQMSTFQDPWKMWLATGSLVTVWYRMPVLGLNWSSALPSSSGYHSPAFLPLVGGVACTQWPALLWCLLNPFFCERARLALEPFTGKFSLSLSLFFLLSGNPTVWLAILL